MVVLSFVLTLTINQNIDLGISSSCNQMDDIKETTLNLFKEKIADPKLVGYIQFTYNTSNNNLNISSLFIKEQERNNGYGILLMIFYLCAFLKNVHNSYFIKNISLDDHSNRAGTISSIYHKFGFRTTEEPTMTFPFFKSSSQQNKRGRDEDNPFDHLNNIIYYYNNLLDTYSAKLSLIKDNFCFELSLIDGHNITTKKLNIPECMTKFEILRPETRSMKKQRTSI